MIIEADAMLKVVAEVEDGLAAGEDQEEGQTWRCSMLTPQGRLRGHPRPANRLLGTAIIFRTM
jgi:hypothetical protein